MATSRLQTLRPVREDRGFTMIEVIVAMSILIIVMTGVTALFASGTKSQADLEQRLTAQTNLRLGLDKLRREVHGACVASTSSATSVTVTLGAGCATTVTWCTQGSGSRYGLYRVLGATCSGGTMWADYLTTGSVFAMVAKNTPANSYSIARLHVVFTVDAEPAVPGGTFGVIDDIAFRNSARQ
jgi:prepilin-type N-terminal cleavage/methylation domain-containing protein